MIDLNPVRVGPTRDGHEAYIEAERESERVVGREFRARTCVRRKKGKGASAPRRATAAIRCTRYTAETGTRSTEREARNTEKSGGRKRRKNYGERGPAVITSAGLNGGISRYLWHNFTGFTMAYIRGPAERISPRGTYICPTGTFVIRRPRRARRSSRMSRLVALTFRRIRLPYPLCLSSLTPPTAIPCVFVHLVPNDGRRWRCF